MSSNACSAGELGPQMMRPNTRATVERVARLTAYPFVSKYRSGGGGEGGCETAVATPHVTLRLRRRLMNMFCMRIASEPHTAPLHSATLKKGNHAASVHCCFLSTKHVASR